MVLPVKDDAVKAVPTCIKTPHLKHIESYVLPRLTSAFIQTTVIRYICEFVLI